ncbi:MAG TPA: alkaline phosphatase D family protein [Acidimicrobiales bacterium]|nr:alkaline phosphatase D family protein [Acidimicrobiales bacterium]
MTEAQAGPPFAHGVASGDPVADGVVLWTRLSPSGAGPLDLRWQVATTPDLGQVVAEGHTEAVAERDFTVKVDVGGLDPGTTYYYRFESAGRLSPVGRTRTAPTGVTERIRLGVVSCACWSHGFFNAYRHLAERDVDLVLHLGDYIYEDGDAWEEVDRVHQPPHRLRTLADYRSRHAQYKTDLDLQELHRRHPMVALWDDHDVAGNAWRDGAADHDPDADGDWGRRRAAAIRAYLEWLPVRTPDESRPDRIHRSFRLGDLVDLTVLDTRLAGRDRPAAEGERPVAAIGRERSLLGAEQWAWLRAELRSSSARWHVLANQVMVAPLRVLDIPGPLRRLVPGLVAGGVGVNSGQWDGYPEERARLFALLEERGLQNVVVLTGDLHSSWAGELTLDPKGRTEAVGVEFVTPSVTSRSFAEEVAPPVPGGRAALRRLVASQNPHFRFFDLEGHGYVLMDVTPERLRAEFWHVRTVAERVRGERLVATRVVRHGEARIT